MKALAGDSDLFPDLDREHPAKVAIRRRLPHIGPSSLCGRLAGRCLGKMSGEECGCGRRPHQRDQEKGSDATGRDGRGAR